MSTPTHRETHDHDSVAVTDWSGVDGLVCGFGNRRTEPPAETLLLQRQVHGARVVDADADRAKAVRDETDGLARIATEADALVARAAGTVVGVRTADCVPILLVAPRARWAAAVHAGWRGTLAGIAREAVLFARSAGIAPDEIHAALGPSIGACCYEVSAELAADFARAGLAGASTHEQSPMSAQSPVSAEPRISATAASSKSALAGPARPHLDLRAANSIVLENSGVPRGQILNVGPCTRCANDRYHSFRAEPAAGGRQISWIGWSR
jgi:polyphenol oxidase